MKREKILYVLTSYFILMGFFYDPCFSQNSNNPYSVYGIGDIDNNMYNRTSGMAGTGLALRSSAYLVDNNPASIAGLPRSFYIFNIVGMGKTDQFAGTLITADNNTSKDLWIKGISLSVKVNKFWASSFGFHQLSNVNYNLSGFNQVQGNTTQYQVSDQGIGGLNDYYWTNAFSLGKHFMAGLKSSFIAGGITQSEIFSDQTLLTTIQTNQQDYYYRMRFELGGIYYTSISKNWDLSLGGTVTTKTRMPSDRTLSVIENGTTLVNDQYLSTGFFTLPVIVAGGIALTHNNKSTLVADYTFENWAPLGLAGTGWQYINNNRISAGYELTKQVNRLGRVVEKNSLQLGAYYTSGYLSVNNTPIKDFGITVGTVGNLRAGSLSYFLYNLSLAVGQRGSQKNNLIQDNYFQLTFGLSYVDFLFSKGKKYD